MLDYKQTDYISSTLPYVINAILQYSLLSVFTVITFSIISLMHHPGDMWVVVSPITGDIFISIHALHHDVNIWALFVFGLHIFLLSTLVIPTWLGIMLWIPTVSQHEILAPFRCLGYVISTLLYQPVLPGCTSVMWFWWPSYAMDYPITWDKKHIELTLCAWIDSYNLQYLIGHVIDL